jgi:hypothetical protein
MRTDAIINSHLCAPRMPDITLLEIEERLTKNCAEKASGVR